MVDRITMDDVAAGRVAPKVIENGVVVPPGLQVNCLTPKEHRERVLRLWGPIVFRNVFPGEEP